uniref:Transmembrane protein 14C n=1 Tax=Cuerna arida TaxID=1464854 RepID=A0A1B6EV52_9HEMI
MAIDYISFAYAASVAAGGIIGYVKAGSMPSLGAGLLFGSVLGFGAYQTSRDPNNYYVLLGTSTVLGGIMGARFYNSGKIMPAGLITVLSVLMICRLGAKALGMTAIDNFSRDK